MKTCLVLYNTSNVLNNTDVASAESVVSIGMSETTRKVDEDNGGNYCKWTRVTLAGIAGRAGCRWGGEPAPTCNHCYYSVCRDRGLGRLLR